MKLCCEVMVSDILPAVRALVSKELTDSYDLNQSEISKKLGVTQPAVSQYRKELRGRRVRILQTNKEIMGEIRTFAKKIGTSELEACESCFMICRLCEKVRKEKVMSQINKQVAEEFLACNLK